MAISVIKRPLGHVLDTTERSACIWDDYGSALVVAAGHGLSTGDYVYIKSNVSNYNGFWYVVYNNGSSFYLREYSTASNLAGVVDTCEVTYQYSVLDHYFNCVHLPIVYKVLSTKWPVNNTDTSRTISSITDDNGLCNLNLSGSLGTFNELEYVKISSNTDFPDEVYQIIDKVSTSDITINRAYEAGLSTSGTIILYYQNYFVKFDIYGGLNSAHYWQAQKPFELLTSIDVVPDGDNIATINIAEILKDQISPTENGTLSPYLPNNLDFFTQFYIVTKEYYDSASTGELVSTLIETDDDLVGSGIYGSATNSMLPFKNIHSGNLSAYIYADANNLIKFLSLFDPVLFSGEYFDISFINNIATVSNFGFRIKRDVYIDGTLKETFYDTIGNRGEGLYRKQIEVSGWSEDQIDLTLQATNTVPYELADSPWANNGGSGWTINPTYIASLLSVSGGSGTDTENKVVIPYAITSGQSRAWIVSYAMSLSLSGDPFVGGSATVNFILAYYDASYALLNSVVVGTITRSSSGTSNTSGSLQSVSLVASGTVAYVGFYAQLTFTNAGSVDPNVISTVSFTRFLNSDNYQNVSETKTITVNTDCASQSIYLGWLNYLGGFEYWNFTARKDYIYEVEKSQITEKNIYTNWPNSYGEFANSVTKQIARDSRKKIRVRSQFLTSAQLEGIKYIRFSPLVQVITDKYDVTNVVVDSGSFKTFTDAQDLNTIEFTISFTDQIPSQFE